MIVFDGIEELELELALDIALDTLEQLDEAKEQIKELHEGIEAMWEGMRHNTDERVSDDYADMCDGCPYDMDNDHFKKARYIFDKYKVIGDYVYHGEYEGDPINTCNPDVDDD